MERYETPILYTDVLKKKAPVTALMDTRRIRGGRRYDNPFSDRPLRTLEDPIIDGCPYVGHVGIDLGVGVGTPIYAPFDGKVWTTYTVRGGNRLKLLTDGVELGFSHLMKFAASGYVQKGELIGYSGASGTACYGAHLHVDAEVDDAIADIYPYLFGIWDALGNPVNVPVTTDNYPNTDEWEKPTKTPLPFVAIENINVRRSPGTDKSVVGVVRYGDVISVDRWCDLPNGQIWGRLCDQPWHWVALKYDDGWLANGPHNPGRLYTLSTPSVYMAEESIQGYNMPGWGGYYTPILRKREAFVVSKRFDDDLGNLFGETENGRWYCLYNVKKGWAVDGGWPVTDQYTLHLDGGTDTKTGDYRTMVELREKCGQGELYHGSVRLT